MNENDQKLPPTGPEVTQPMKAIQPEAYLPKPPHVPELSTETTQLENAATQEMGQGTVIVDKQFGEYFRDNGQPVTDEDSNAIALLMNQVNEQISRGEIKPEDADQVRIDTAKKFGFAWRPRKSE